MLPDRGEKRRRWVVPRIVIWLLTSIYRRSWSRSYRSSYEEGIYVLRGIGSYGFGPVLKINRRIERQADD